jgi:pseudaminic acid cytidylyltransferase
MKRIAIIPARGGSKRVPRKNIKDFFGQPIISYSIITALKSELFDEVMVSTDDEEIAEIALKYGAKVPFLRSSINSSDKSTTVDVIIEVIEWYNNIGVFFEQASCIYPCSPLLTIQQLKKSYNQLAGDEVDVVFPVVSYSHPIQRAFYLDNLKKIKPVFDINNFLGTQHFESTYHDAGMFYSFNIKKVLQNRTLRTNNTKVIELSQLEAQDIDDLVDWEIAKLKFQIQLNENV